MSPAIVGWKIETRVWYMPELVMLVTDRDLSAGGTLVDPRGGSGAAERNECLGEVTALSALLPSTGQLVAWNLRPSARPSR